MSKKLDPTTSIQQLKDMVEEFVQARDWENHNTLKNLSMTIAIEAAELMEHFQWEKDYQSDDKEQWSSELGDIIYGCILFAITADIDISTSVRKMIAKAARKYPVEKYGRGAEASKHYQDLKFKKKDPNG